MPPEKSRDPRDAAVGKRVKFFRLKAKLSQEKVGEALGLTFQQVQKYENGMNRIAPSRLIIMAKLFKVPVVAFFGDDAGSGNSKQSDGDMTLVNSRSRMRIMTMLTQIDDVRIETVVCDMLELFIARGA